MILDDLVKQRLCKPRFVAFVMAIFAIAKQIDEDVALKLIAKLHSKADGVGHGFHIVAIDMEYWRLHHFGNVGAVDAGACVEVVGGETNLVVHHDMDGAAGFVAGELRHLYYLVHDTLAGDGRVAMDEDGSHFFKVALIAIVNLGAHDAFHHRVDGFEV